MSAEALNCDTLTSQSQDDAPSLSEVVRLAWARLLGLLTAVKVNIGVTKDLPLSKLLGVIT